MGLRSAGGRGPAPAGGWWDKMEMKQPELKTSRTGSQYLLVYYDRIKDNFDQAIERGIRIHDLKDQLLPIIALPDSNRWWTNAT